MWGTKAYLHSCNAYNLVTACHEREKELSPSLNRQFWFSSSLSLFPQPATAPALPVGVPRYPSVPCVQMGSFSTRASVWRPVGRDSTPRTTPATVRACIWVCLKFYMPVKHASRPWQSALLTFCPPCFQIVIPPVGPVWVPWLQTASAVSNQRKPSCCSPVTSSTASAQRDVLRTASRMTCRHAEVSRKVLGFISSFILEDRRLQGCLCCSWS